MNQFLAHKFNTTKRFGLEGVDVLIPGLKYIIDNLTNLGTEKVIIGMPHRGRLSVLANVLRKPLNKLFSEFLGVVPITKDDESEYLGFSGDVKYHLGTTRKQTYRNGKEIEMSVLANPSHLETVNPVVQGRVRAE